MDALTHAVEAFIGEWATAATDRLALAAVALIWHNLPRAHRKGSDLRARENMALASTYAGMAFTRANVGNVHAIAHQLGGRYHTPHGLANAIMLPGVLRFSLAAARHRLALLGRRIGIAGEGDQTPAVGFCDAVQELGLRLGIPRTLDALREQDIPKLATAACHEADLNYPVPRRMTQADCEALLREVLPTEAVKPAKPVKANQRAAPKTPARKRAAAKGVRR
jgi:alcohol dehydrogenase class IV